MIPAFPLQWPEGFPRTQLREVGQFRSSISAALGNVENSLKLFGSDSKKLISNMVLSSNVTLGVQRPDDPGVAAWFAWDGETRCIAVDRYKTPEANLQAIHHVLEARRTELRHGTLALVRASMKGFTLLLPGPNSPKPWHEVLGVSMSASASEIEAAYRDRAKTAHPDRGGSNVAMAALNAARAQALSERQGR